MKLTFLNKLMISLLAIGLLSAANPKTEQKNSTKNVSQSASDKNNEKGFKQFFNGKDFADWELLLRNGTPEEIKKVYTIDKGGILHYFRDLPEESGSDEARKNAFHGVMASKKSFSMYHLKFEYKWGKKVFNNYKQYQYDAGVFYHISELNVFPVGLQYQIRYDNIENVNHSGDFWAPPGVTMQWYSADGKTFNLPTQGGIEQPTKMGEHLASVDADFHGLDNEWNQCELIVMGNKYVIQKLNGKVVNMATNLWRSEGSIAFEAETGEIMWRNIQIKEFEKSVPIETFLP